MKYYTVKKDLGKHSFEAYSAYSFINERLPEQNFAVSGYRNRVLTFAGQVQYSPYSIAGWRERIAKHQDATTLMIGTKLLVGDHKRDIHVTPYWFSSIAYGGTASPTWKQWSASGFLLSTSGSMPSTFPSVPLAYARAAESFTGNLIKKTHAIRGASVLAEATEAIKGIASPAKALRHEVSNLYRTARGQMYRNAKHGAKAMRDVVSGTWLEWNFGIQPTISDLTDATEAFNQLSTRELQHIFPVRGSATEEELSSIQRYSAPCVPTEGSLSTVMGDFFENRINRTSVQYRGVLVLAANRGGDVPLPTQFGIGLTDVPAALWEAAPWSWMYDYFFNVSKVIDAFAAPLSSVRWANRTVRNSRVHIGTDLQVPPDTRSGSIYTHYKGGGGTYQLSSTSVSRAPINPLDISVGLRMKLPNLSTQWANLAALASYGVNMKAAYKSLRLRR